MTPLRNGLAAAAMIRSRVAMRFWTAIAYVKLRAHGATVGPGLRVLGPIRLHCHRTGSIRIGADCRLLSGFHANAVGGDAPLSIWVGPGGQLTLGDRVGISNTTVVCMRSITLESDVMIGGGSRIYDTDFHSLLPENRGRRGNPGTRTAPILIERHAFVGGHSIVLKGTRVGEAAVIGAGSVVRQGVPARQIWAGNPARFLRDLPAPSSAPRDRVVAMQPEGRP